MDHPEELSGPWTKEQEGRIFDDLMAESDRGCVLLCAANVDTHLEKLFEVHFFTCSGAGPQEWNALLSDKPYAPLQSSVVKARLAFVLGLLPRGVWKAVSSLATLRNDFAHEEFPKPLTTKAVEKIRQRLPNPESVNALIPKGQKEETEKDPRKLLVVTAMTICLILYFKISQLRSAYYKSSMHSDSARLEDKTNNTSLDSKDNSDQTDENS